MVFASEQLAAQGEEQDCYFPQLEPRVKVVLYPP